METSTENTLKSNIIDWIKFIVTLMAIFFLVRTSIGLIKVSGNSMNPSLQDGSIIFMNRFSTHFQTPRYGDVVVINERNLGYDIIKRVIGVPGDTVEIKKGIVYVNGNALSEKYTEGKSGDLKEQKVREGHLFVIGDNRTPGESLDSRDEKIGSVEISSIKGYAVISVSPYYKILKP